MALRWICGGLLCACAVGCGDRADSPGYLPGWPEARSALIASLTDWRDTTPPFPPSRELGGILFADKQRKPGDRLRSFAILGESEVENARQFTVRLEVEGEEAPRLVRYNVLGRDPIWVFRLEDYEMISHWEHPMNDEESAPSPPQPRPSESRTDSGRREEGPPGRPKGSPPTTEGSARPSPEPPA